MKIDRPGFLAGSLAVAAALGLRSPAAAARASEVPQRRLGRTNEMVSVIGLGGYHLGKPDLTEPESIALMHDAIDRGVTFMDNCWDYNKGESLLRMGKGLAAGGYRRRVFLMSKIDGRTKASAAAQIDQTLKSLQTTHLDLLQFHENIRPNDADRIFAAGGAFEAVIAAKRAGKIRFIGFTGHKSPAYHLHMIEVARRHGFTFDTVQMPLNVMDAHYDSFQQQVLPVANRLDMGVLAMKTFGDPHILDTKAIDPVTMLHYSMNLPVSVVVTGIDRPEILEQAIVAAHSFEPLSKAQVSAILAKTATLAMDGKTELYKTTTTFDGTTHNPQWLTTATIG